MKYKINFNICGSVYINNCNEDEAFEKAADGQSTKIIIPADIQNMAGLVTSAAELIKGKK